MRLRSTLLPPVLALATACLLLCCALAAAAPVAPPAPPKREFPPLVWQVDERVAKALKSFTSPADPGLVFVSSEGGLWRSRDGGANWELIAGTRPADIGTISSLVVCPARPDLVVLGSLDKGVFLSRDGGTTWRKCGGKAEGLSSEKVHQVEFAREDHSWSTILASHGADATGLSKSVDEGLSWRVVCPSRHVLSFVDMGQCLVAASSAASQPDDWQLARSITYGEAWQVVGRPEDTSLTVGALNLLKPVRIVWGTRGSGLLSGKNDGQPFDATAAAPDGNWSSVFVTPGADPHEEWFWAYDPFRYGLLSGRDFKERWSPHNNGLYVNRMTKQGANVCANANGTRFYACVNDSLYVGNHVASADGPTIREARVDPPVRFFRPWSKLADARRELLQSCDAVCKGSPLDDEVARMSRIVATCKELEPQRRFAVRVRVEHPKGPGAVKSVTVTPDLMGVGAVTLYDDGQHDDGKPGDGLWAGAFTFDEKLFWNHQKIDEDGRSPFPGIRGVAVTALDDAGKGASWTLVLGVFFEREPFILWPVPVKPESDVPPGKPYSEGNVKVELKDKVGSTGGKALEIVGAKGPWDAYWGSPEAWEGPRGGRMDVTGLKYVAFRFRGSPGAGDVAFFLVDELGAPSGEVIDGKYLSNAVPLLKDKHVAAMDGNWHEVKVPLIELVRNIRFMRNDVVGFGLRAPADSPGGTYAIDEVRLSDE